jgi:hypothetical protein
VRRRCHEQQQQLVGRAGHFEAVIVAFDANVIVLATPPLSSEPRQHTKRRIRMRACVGERWHLKATPQKRQCPSNNDSRQVQLDWTPQALEPEFEEHRVSQLAFFLTHEIVDDILRQVRVDVRSCAEAASLFESRSDLDEFCCFRSEEEGSLVACRSKKALTQLGKVYLLVREANMFQDGLRRRLAVVRVDVDQAVPPGGVATAAAVPAWCSK